MEKILAKYPPMKISSLSLSILMLLGLLGIGFIALCLNFIFPLSTALRVLVLFAGWGSLFQFRNALVGRVLKEEMFVAVLSALGASLIAVSSSCNVDTGYYHLPSVSLIQNFSLIPGIANVFGPYGHTSTWFFLEAIMGLPGLGFTGSFSLNSILGVVFVMFLWEMKDRVSYWGLSFLFAALLLLNQGFLSLGGLTPDFPTFVLGSVLWLWFIEAVFVRGSDHIERIVLGGLVTLFAITIKASNILMVVPYFGLILKSGKSKKSFKEFKNSIADRTWVGIAGFAVLFLVLWVGRNLMTSGCLLYPQSGTCFVEISWAMPLRLVEGWLADVKFHLCGVRSTESIFANPACFQEWSRRLLREPLLKYVSFIIVSSGVVRLLNGYHDVKAGAGRGSVKSFLFICSILTVSIIIWLKTAPNIRFASWMFIAIAGLSLRLIMNVTNLVDKRRKGLFYGCLMIGFLATLRSAIITNPVGIKWLHWPEVPVIGSRIIQEDKNMQVRTPVEGFQCWGISPPCTPEKKSVVIEEKLGRTVIYPESK